MNYPFSVRKDYPLNSNLHFVLLLAAEGLDVLLRGDSLVKSVAFGPKDCERLLEFHNQVGIFVQRGAKDTTGQDHQPHPSV